MRLRTEETSQQYIFNGNLHSTAWNYSGYIETYHILNRITSDM